MLKLVKLVNNVALLEATPISSVLLANSVRYRYFKDKVKLGMKGYGYEDKMDFRGPLPRIPTGMALPMPPYIPKKRWTEKKALFGQNDYIDILGDVEGLKPIQFQTHIPMWLRGFNGNEYQMLIRKRAIHGTKIKAARPTEWHNLKKRIKYLYRFLNYNTKNFMDKKVLRR